MKCLVCQYGDVVEVRSGQYFGGRPIRKAVCSFCKAPHVQMPDGSFISVHTVSTNAVRYLKSTF